jgi:RNA polymerase subunit RPABC4/transcription elongation factor Spt4
MPVKVKRCRDCGMLGSGHTRDCPRALAKMGSTDKGVLSRGRQCPACKRLLAAGAPCPEHGTPPLEAA